MESHKSAITEMIGEEKFNEEMDVLQKMKVFEDQKGMFVHVEGDVDYRPESLTKFTLDTGF